MGGDHYAAMELLNNLYVAVHKKPRDIEVFGRARSNKSPARAAREFRCQLRVIKIPRLRFSKRGTGAVAFKQGWVCASTTERLNRVGYAPAPQNMSGNRAGSNQQKESNLN